MNAEAQSRRDYNGMNAETRRRRDHDVISDIVIGATIEVLKKLNE